MQLPLTELHPFRSQSPVNQVRNWYTGPSIAFSSQKYVNWQLSVTTQFSKQYLRLRTVNSTLHQVSSRIKVYPSRPRRLAQCQASSQRLQIHAIESLPYVPLSHAPEPVPSHGIMGKSAEEQLSGLFLGVRRKGSWLRGFKASWWAGGEVRPWQAAGPREWMLSSKT